MIRGLWDREMVALMLLAALMPMALVWLWFGGIDAAARLVLALLVAGFWHIVFMLARAQPPSLAGAITALAVAMLAPEDLGLIRMAMGISFGAVFGELVFGGWGRNVVNPATVTLAFLGFGFPSFPWPERHAVRSLGRGGGGRGIGRVGRCGHLGGSGARGDRSGPPGS